MTITRKGARSVTAFALVALASWWSPAVLEAEAPTRDARTWAFRGVKVTFSTPETYNDCTPAHMKDTVLTDGVPANWRLVGRVNVGYITTSAFVITQILPVNQRGDLSLQLEYPPHSAVTRLPDGPIEYHVQPQIEVLDVNGTKVHFVGGDLKRAPGTLGPGGQDWDVTCYEPSSTTTVR